MTESVKAPVKGGAIVYLSIDGAVKAAEFYQRAFAGTLAALVPPDEEGRTMHAHLYINGSSVMLSDFFPEHGYAPVPPAAFNITLAVDNTDTWYERAIAAGCTSKVPISDMFWGDRYGQVQDPFGIVWAINGPVKSNVIRRAAMKNYLAVYFGKSDAMEAWKALPESERKDREQAGMAAWHKWVADHNGVISEMGSPLGKTKRADKNGMSDTRNELCAWTVVKANSQEEATRLFLNHPHFTIFPGDHIEVMECLPVPGMA